MTLMPQYKTGNMWDVFDSVDYFLVTTNSTLKSDGSLVMGAGIAKQARDKFPGLAEGLGKMVAAAASDGGFYGVLLGAGKVCAFQTKRHFKDPSNEALIAASVTELRNIATQLPNKTFALNYPGIGHGGLYRAQVRPLLETLPDNVQIWSFEATYYDPASTHQPKITFRKTRSISPGETIPGAGRFPGVQIDR